MDIVEFEARQRAQYKAHRKDKMIPSRFKCQSFEQWLLTGYLEAVTEVKSLHQAMLDMLCAVVGEGSGGKRLMRTPKTAFMARQERAMSDDDLRQLGDWVRKAGLERYVRRQMERQSNRVFIPGAFEPHGLYGWIIREDHTKPNPYYIVTDDTVAGLWYRADQFRRVIEERPDARQP